MTLQLLIAGIMAVTMVSNPVAFAILFDIETALSEAAKALAVLDLVVSLLLIGERDSAEGKFLAAKDAVFDSISIIISFKFDDIVNGLGDDYKVTKTLYQTVSGIEQSIYNTTEWNIWMS